MILLLLLTKAEAACTWVIGHTMAQAQKHPTKSDGYLKILRFFLFLWVLVKKNQEKLAYYLSQ